jgi:hypothetical protein
MARTRAERRVKNRRVKAKFRGVLSMYVFGRHGNEPEARQVGRWASTHGRPCSCMGCKRGPRPSKAPPMLFTDFEPDEFYRTLEDDRDADYELDMIEDDGGSHYMDEDWPDDEDDYDYDPFDDLDDSYYFEDFY